MKSFSLVNLIMTQCSVLRNSLVAFWYLLLFLQSVFLVTSAVLELIFSPSLALKYYLPALFRSDGSISLNVFLLFCILVQLLNFLAASSLFASLLSGYNSKCLAYDRVSMLSIACSLALLTHKTLTGIDLYGSQVELVIYQTEIGRSPEAQGKLQCSGNNKKRVCVYSDTYIWHQKTQCCGWTSPDDVVVVNNEDYQILPLFCCYQATDLLKSNVTNNGSENKNHTTASNELSLVIERNFTIINGENTPQNNCTLHSINRFSSLCSSKSEQAKGPNSFLPVFSATAIGHPVSWKYSAFKMVVALVYCFTKKHSLLPQSEGIFAHQIITP